MVEKGANRGGRRVPRKCWRPMNGAPERYDADFRHFCPRVNWALLPPFFFLQKCLSLATGKELRGTREAFRYHGLSASIPQRTPQWFAHPRPTARARILLGTRRDGKVTFAAH